MRGFKPNTETNKHDTNLDPLRDLLSVSNTNEELPNKKKTIFQVILDAFLNRDVPKRESENMSLPEQDDYDARLLNAMLRTGKGFLGKIEDEISGRPSQIELEGRKDGYMMINPLRQQVGVEGLEKTYDGYASHFQELVKKIRARERAQAAKQIELLKTELEKAESDLDINEEGSAAHRITTQIEEKDKELENFLNRVHESRFYDQYNQAIDERSRLILEEIELIQKDIENIGDATNAEFEELNRTLTEMMVRFRAEMDAPLGTGNKSLAKKDQSIGDKAGEKDSPEQLKVQSEADGERPPVWVRIYRWLFGYRAKNNPTDEDHLPSRFVAYIHHLKAIKLLIQEFPLVLKKASHITEEKEDALSLLKADIMDNLEAMRSFAVKDLPLILPKSVILIYYVITAVIFIGEVYLIYAFLSDTLGFDFKKDIGWGFSTIFGYAFCFAFPLALGLYFKEKIAEGIMSIRLSIVVIALLAIAIPNALGILAKGSETVLTLESLSNPLSIVKVFGIAIFLPLLSLIFARVGAWTFTYAQENHTRYKHITRQSLILSIFQFKKKWDRQIELEEEIEALKAELLQLQAEKEEKRNALIRSQALSKENDKVMDMKTIFVSLKEATVAQYKAGFSHGRSQREQEMDEEFLTRLRNKQQIFDV